MERELFNKVVLAFDQINESDPNFINVEGKSLPHEFVYSNWLSEWIHRLNPDASDALLVAAKCQHVKRWEIPRSIYPEGLKGYTKWKKDLAQFHADTASKVLLEIGFESDFIEKVKEINLKKNLKSNKDVQTMEDALCLVTLEFQLEGFSAKHDDEKMIGIIQKTWAKMSEQAKSEALKLKYSERVLSLIKKSIK